MPFIVKYPDGDTKIFTHPELAIGAVNAYYIAKHGEHKWPKVNKDYSIRILPEGE